MIVRKLHDEGPTSPVGIVHVGEPREGRREKATRPGLWMTIAMQPPIFIYALVSTRDDRPGYIGQSVDIEGRHKIHLQCLNPDPERRDAASTFGKPVYEWIRSEVKAGFQIETRVIEETPDSASADNHERCWIAKLRAAGYTLHNSTSGNGHRTPNWREKVLARARARLASDREWLSKTLGRPEEAEVRGAERNEA